MATLWSWAVFGHVVESASGEIWAVGTTLGYPLFDLVLIASAVLAVAARGWRFDAVLFLLVAGMLVLIAADSVYAAQVAKNTYEKDTILEAMWPLSMVLMMGASLARPAPKAEPMESDAMLLSMALVAAAIAVTGLVLDHFSRLDETTMILATATLAAACVQVILLERERSRADRRARDQEAIRRASIAGALDCVISVDERGEVVEWNAAATRTFGYRREEALGVRLGKLILPPDQDSRPHSALGRLCESSLEGILNRRTEVQARHRRGGLLPVELAVIEVRANPRVYTAFMRDLSRSRRREEENHRLAAILRSSEDSVLSKDLNGTVTSWNRGAEELYGYPAEEAIGRSVGSLIVPEDRLDELDEIMATVFAGEQLAIETERHTRDGKRLYVSLQTFPIRNLAGEVTGATAVTHDITERRLREEQAHNDHESQLWRSRLRRSFGDGSLMLWGQPIVAAGSHALDHHELLLRMQIDGEIISPGKFLPHVEDSPMISDLDRWVVKRGLEYARHTPVAINLSAKSVAQPDMAQFIADALDSPEHALNAVFEITETAAVENLAAARELVTQLSDLGCRVALDDFGTGYGSFIYLKHLPVSEIKIDMQFIRDLAEDETDQRIVRSIIAVARNFQMKTVAEGIEDEKTLQLLESYGVDFLQGYHLGRPAAMPTGKTRAHRDPALSVRQPVA